MTRDLAVEAARYLASKPEGAGFKEVAQAIHARMADVRGVLLDDDRFAGPFMTAGHPPRFVYRLSIFVPVEPAGTARRTA